MRCTPHFVHPHTQVGVPVDRNRALSQQLAETPGGCVNYYVVLGVTRDTSAGYIRAVYR
jgi:hypothetical protein